MKTVVITGVTRGLGRAMAEEFVRLGHKVLGCGRSDAAIAELQQAAPAPNEFKVVNVTSDEQVMDWAMGVIQRHGPPDLILNNAGVINQSDPLWKISAGEFSTVIDVNIKGVANVIRHFFPAMVKRQQGIVVNFSSGWGRSTDAGVAPYCATKWAIEGLTLAMAAELPSGMAAIPLNPGIINTQMLQTCFGASASDYPTPSQWARRAVPFLLNLSPRDNGRSLTVE